MLPKHPKEARILFAWGYLVSARGLSICGLFKKTIFFVSKECNVGAGKSKPSKFVMAQISREYVIDVDHLEASFVILLTGVMKFREGIDCSS